MGTYSYFMLAPAFALSMVSAIGWPSMVSEICWPSVAWLPRLCQKPTTSARRAVGWTMVCFNSRLHQYVCLYLSYMDSLSGKTGLCSHRGAFAQRSLRSNPLSPRKGRLQPSQAVTLPIHAQEHYSAKVQARSRASECFPFIFLLFLSRHCPPSSSLPPPCLSPPPVLLPSTLSVARLFLPWPSAFRLGAPWRLRRPRSTRWASWTSPHR